MKVDPLIPPSDYLTVEVGDTVKFVATWIPGGGALLIGYEWESTYNDEHQQGLSNINGSTNGVAGYDPIFRTHSTNTDTIYFIWGDHNDALSDFISVTAKYYFTGSMAEYFTGAATYLVYIYKIGTPAISSPNSIQDCCTESVQYCDENILFQDNWDWSVSGGTQISSDGHRCISVTPNTPGNISITCIATRTTNTHGYSRTGTKTITRDLPQTPPITGPSYVCKGTTITLCTDEICALDGTHWTDAYPNLNLMSGEGDICAVFRPNNITTNGTVATIRALSELIGDCEALSSSKEITIYDSGAPPTPNGYLTIEFDEEYDPCSDEENIYQIHYFGSYPNGIITVNPSIIIDVPHHHLNDDFYVEVCYHNLCGGGNTCRTYHLYLPEPCEDWPIINPKPKQDFMISKRSVEVNTQHAIRSSSDHLNVFPNPSKDYIFIDGLNGAFFDLELYTLDGEKVIEKTNLSGKEDQIDISSVRSNGMYFLRVVSNNTEYIQKLTIQR